MAFRIQSLWFRKDNWTEEGSKGWCEDHDFSVEEPVHGENHWIWKQIEQEEDAKYRVIADDFPEGLSARVMEVEDEDEKMKTSKQGTQSAENPFTFVLSTEDVDRDGDIIRQNGISIKDFKKNPIVLYQHDHRQPIGTWENIRFEGKKLMADLKLAALGTSELIDTIHKLVEQRILRAVSIGFGVKEYEALNKDDPWGGYDITKTELYEASLVSVPANQNALRVKAAKIVPEDLKEIFLEVDDKGSKSRARKVDDLPRKSKTGALPADPNTIHRQKEKRPMTLAEKIRAKQERLVAIKDRLTELKALAEQDDYELEDEEESEIAELSEESEAVTKAIESLEKISNGLAQKAVPVGGKPGARPSTPARAAKKEKGGSLLIKTMTAAVIAKMTDQRVNDVIESIYADDDRIRPVSKSFLATGGSQFLMNKTAVDAADTTTPGWAAELVRDDIRGFIEELRSFSVYAALYNAGMGLDFGNANSITVPRRDRTNQNNGAQMGGSWVGEGGVIPVKQMALASQTLNRYKVAVISAFTNELMQQSVPNIEAIIRDAILEDTGLAIDAALLDNSATVAGVRPAGLLNGVTLTASAGNSAANIITDLKVLFSAMNAINGSQPYLILNSNRLLGLSTVTTAAGGFMFRDDVSAGRLLGVPFIASPNVPADVVLIVDANSFAGANAIPMFAVTDQATLVMANADDTAPTQAGVATDHTGGDLGTAEQVPVDGGIIVTGDTTGAPAGTSVTGYSAQSMFQQYQTAVRMIMPSSWGLTRAGSVAGLSGVNW